MIRSASSGARAIALTMILALVGACDAIPRSGPSKREVFAGSVLREGDAFVVDVTPRVTAATSVAPSLGFSSAFRIAPPIGSDTIRPGDRLSLVIYENVQDGLLGESGASAIDEVQVDSSGMIFVPYAGRLRAAGNTPETLRGIITARLNEQTPDPQVVVQRVAGDGATVSVVGGATGQGVYPIERPTRTLTAMIAAAGGVAVDPDIARVNVTRGSRTETAYLSDLYRDAGADIALRDGDTIFIEADPRAFTVLGATGGQRRLEFETEVLSAVEALAQVGGLDPLRANPTGVFVLRDETESIARAVLGRNDLIGPQRMVYVLDLTEPNGLFDARDFVIRDGDLIYVTEAGLVAWNRSVAAIFGSLGQLTSAATSVERVGN